MAVTVALVASQAPRAKVQYAGRHASTSIDQ